MKIQKFLHSCLLIEHENARVLFDPGLYSFIEGRVKPDDFKNIDAVFITHSHADHVDPAALRIILKNNPRASVYGNAETVKALQKEGITVLVFEEGERRIKGFPVWAKFAQHATILSHAPENTAYIVGGKLLITGDSFDEELEKLKEIQVLALPIMAPWLRAVDAVAFAASVGAKKIIPVHDGFAGDFFLERQYEGFSKNFKEIGAAFVPLHIGGGIEV